MKLRTRSAICLGFLALAVNANLQAQTSDTSAKAGSAALRARIATLPGRSVELRKVDPTATPVDPVREEKATSAARRPPAAAVRPSPLPPEARVTGATARYIPLPASESAATSAALTQQLGLKPPRAGVPGIVPFAGALVTQAADSTEVLLIPTVVVDDPLRFDAATRQFLGSIAVGLVELGVKGPPKPLPTWVTFQTLGAVVANPEEAEVKTTAPPFRRIAIAARAPGDKVELRVFSTGMDPVVVVMPVERARLQLAAKPRLQGWGLESTEVTIAASDGAASKGQEVVLQPPALGTLTPMTLRLEDNGTATAKLRSESTGSVQIVASSSTLGAPEPLSIEFEFPTRFLLSGLVGGLAGSILKRGGKRAGARRWARDLLLGVLTGAVVLGLFVFGVNVTGFPLPPAGGEVLVFVVAALGAFVGTQLLQPKVATRG